MIKYYTRVCNFYYGAISRSLLKKKKSLALNGNLDISFDHIEILTRRSKKKIHFKEIKKLNKSLQKKINRDLKLITNKINNFSNLNFNKIPNIMGILNLTPDSFSDGGKYNKKDISINHAKNLDQLGSNLIDVGGESTRPGSKDITVKEEWNRIESVLTRLNTKINLSLDTRKSKIMEKGIKLGVKLINDISGLNYDKKTVEILRKYKTPFVINHIQGTPQTMQKNPKYKNALLDIYDFFDEKIKFLRKSGINHNKIILDPGIGFGKNLKHNLNLLSNISIFHSLGFPILLGISRKKFIKEISGKNDSNTRVGGTIATSLFVIKQGIQIIRVHDVNEIIQSIKIFNKLNETK